MDSEHIIAEVARWRETFTLEQLMGMFIEGMGGQDAVDAAVDEIEEQERDSEGRDLDAMRDADVARLETIQGMAESFCTWLHAKGAQQMEKDDDEAVDKVRQLSTSFNKAARAVRLSMVLKHEVAGLRPLPNVRVAAEAANQNGSAHGPAARTASPASDAKTARWNAPSARRWRKSSVPICRHCPTRWTRTSSTPHRKSRPRPSGNRWSSS